MGICRWNSCQSKCALEFELRQHLEKDHDFNFLVENCIQKCHLCDKAVENHAWENHSIIHLPSEPVVSVLSQFVYIMCLNDKEKSASLRLRDWKSCYRLKRHMLEGHKVSESSSCPLCGPSDNIYHHFETAHENFVVQS